MQPDALKYAQSLLAVWQEKARMLTSLCELTEQMMHWAEEETLDEFTSGVELRADKMKQVDALDGRAAIFLRALDSSAASLSAGIDAELRTQLEQARKQAADALRRLQQLDGQLHTVAQNQMLLLGVEIRDTREQILVNNEYNQFYDNVETTTFDQRL